MATRPVRGPQARRVGSVRCHGAPSGGEGHADGASEGCAKGVPKGAGSMEGGKLGKLNLLRQAMDKSRPTQNKPKATGSFHASTSQPVKPGPSKSLTTTPKRSGKASANPTPTTSADAQVNEAAPTTPVMAPPSPPQRIDDDLSAAWQLQRYRAAQRKAQKGELPRVTESPIPDQVSPQAGPSGQSATGSGRRPPEPTTTSGKGTAPVKGKAPQRPGKETRAEKRALNNSTSPRGDYKKQKVERPSRPTAISYSDAVSSDLKVAVTCARSGNLTREIATTFIKNMTQAMVKVAWKPEGGSSDQMPVFVTRPTYVEGAIRVTCEDQLTLNWLKGIAADPQMCQGNQLVVKPQVDLPRRVRCGMFVPDQFDILTDTRDIGRLLYRQNRWIDIKEWQFLDGEKQAEGWFINLTIPETQIPTVLAHNRRLACTINQCYLKFLGKGGKYYETPQTSTSAQPTDMPTPQEQEQNTSDKVADDASNNSSTAEQNKGDQTSQDPQVSIPGTSGLQQVSSPAAGESLGTLSGASLSDGDDAEAMLASLYLDEDIYKYTNLFSF
ncbi:hypothetical protein RR48_12064 [Papilio machaon]|uniref:DUF4780 domain-containing protein n=1 Tax=Papilio machaon TaxID=76193 RepID=A0A194RQB5_PAPMA|nr:hypothetical protein RR48_12064 [Papilio machaon]